MGTGLKDLAKNYALASLSALNKPMAERRLVQELSRTNNACIAIGGGFRHLDGWLSTDIHWKTKYYLNLLAPWPIPVGSISRVYADNVIEHFPIDQTPVVLSGIYTALMPGGRIRLATPDVERTARIYLEDPRLAEMHLARHRARGYQVKHAVDLLRVTFSEAGHHLGYLFDFAALKAELEAVGFVDVVRCEAGETGDALFSRLEDRSSESERATALVVEAQKQS